MGFGDPLGLILGFGASELLSVLLCQWRAHLLSSLSWCQQASREGWVVPFITHLGKEAHCCH